MRTWSLDDNVSQRVRHFDHRPGTPNSERLINVTFTKIVKRKGLQKIQVTFTKFAERRGLQNHPLCTSEQGLSSSSNTSIDSDVSCFLVAPKINVTTVYVAIGKRMIRLPPSCHHARVQYGDDFSPELWETITTSHINIRSLQRLGEHIQSHTHT